MLLVTTADLSLVDTLADTTIRLVLVILVHKIVQPQQMVVHPADTYLQLTTNKQITANQSTSLSASCHCDSCLYMCIYTLHTPFCKGAQKKTQNKTRKSRSVVFTWDCVFLAYCVKCCCASF
jgi:hypothetical protein